MFENLAEGIGDKSALVTSRSKYEVGDDDHHLLEVGDDEVYEVGDDDHHLHVDEHEVGDDDHHLNVDAVGAWGCYSEDIKISTSLCCDLSELGFCMGQLGICRDYGLRDFECLLCKNTVD